MDLTMTNLHTRENMGIVGGQVVNGFLTPKMEIFGEAASFFSILGDYELWSRDFC